MGGEVGDGLVAGVGDGVVRGKVGVAHWAGGAEVGEGVSGREEQATSSRTSTVPSDGRLLCIRHLQVAMCISTGNGYQYFCRAAA